MMKEWANACSFLSGGQGSPSRKVTYEQRFERKSKPSVETASQEEGKQVYWPRGMIVLCMFED